MKDQGKKKPGSTPDSENRTEQTLREQGHSRDDIKEMQGEDFPQKSGGGGGSPTQQKNRKQEKTGRSSDAPSKGLSAAGDMTPKKSSSSKNDRSSSKNDKENLEDVQPGSRRVRGDGDY